VQRAEVEGDVDRLAVEASVAAVGPFSGETGRGALLEAEGRYGMENVLVSDVITLPGRGKEVDIGTL